MTVTPYKVRISQDTIDDLRNRLINTRWPDEIPGTEWDYGANLGYMKELVDYWINTYDWRKEEAALNSFNHFRSTIEGIGIHFIHERGHGPNPIPIIITHGWPGSVFELTKLIRMLSDPGSNGGDPSDAFDAFDSIDSR